MPSITKMLNFTTFCTDSAKDMPEKIRISCCHSADTFPYKIQKIYFCEISPPHHSDSTSYKDIRHNKLSNAIVYMPIYLL